MTSTERAVQTALAETIYLKHVLMGIVATSAAKTGRPSVALKALSDALSNGIAEDLAQNPEALAIAQERVDLFVSGALKLALAHKPPRTR